jgi:hypothetical protein
MKNKLKILEVALFFAGFKEIQYPVLKVYLSIVLLGKKIPEVAKYFNLTEKKVQHALTVCGVSLNKCALFRMKLRITTRSYNFFNSTQIAA